MDQASQSLSQSRPQEASSNSRSGKEDKVSSYRMVMQPASPTSALSHGSSLPLEVMQEE